MNEREEDLCRDILEYLALRPDAEDTLEGIAQWWLLEQRIQMETDRVKRALDALVGRQLLVSRQGPDRRTYYRRKGN